VPSYRLDHLQEIIQRNALVESSLSMEHLYSVREQMEKAEARKLHPLYIQSFFEEAFSHLNGELRPREQGRFEITHVPARIRERDRRIGSGRTPVMQRYERVCFEKNRIQIPHKRQASLLHPGHPLMQAVNDLIREDYCNTLDQGAVLVNPADHTTESRILLMLEHAVRETHGTSPRLVSRRLQFIHAWPDGRFTHAGWAPHLALQPLDTEYTDLAEEVKSLDWVQALDDGAVLAFAAEKLVPEHFDEVQRRRHEQVDKTKTAVKDRLMREIEFQWDRYHKLTEEVEAGKQPRIQPDNARREAERLTARLEARIAEVDAQRDLASSTPRILSAALVIPYG